MDERVETIAVLDAVRDVLSTPDRWTRHSFAVTAEGIPVRAGSPVACRWCLVGAITATYERRLQRRGDHITPTVAPNTVCVALGTTLMRERRDSTGCLTVFNDTPSTTHADVLALIDATLARLRSEL